MAGLSREDFDVAAREIQGAWAKAQTRVPGPRSVVSHNADAWMNGSLFISPVTP